MLSLSAFLIHVKVNIHIYIDASASLLESRAVVVSCADVGTVPGTSRVCKLISYLPHTVSAHPQEDPAAFLRSNIYFTCLWSDWQSLNLKQVEAMKKALQYKFSLIQGPPGACNTT